MKRITFTAFDNSSNRTHSQTFVAKDTIEAVEHQQAFENDVPFNRYWVEPDFIAESEDSMKKLFELEEDDNDKVLKWTDKLAE